MGFVEDDHAVKVAAQPGQDLVEARRFVLALGRAQRGVGNEQDALVQPDGCALAVARQGLHQEALLPQGGPVALRVLDQRVVFGNPQRAAPALEPVVENNARDLTAFADTGAIAQKEAAPETHRAVRIVRRRAKHVEGGIDRPTASEMARMGFAGKDQGLQLGVRQDALGDQTIRKMRPIAGLGRRHRGHRRRLHQSRGRGRRAGQPDRLQRV
jgi:hypothetical protein